MSGFLIGLIIGFVIVLIIAYVAKIAGRVKK